MSFPLRGCGRINNLKEVCFISSIYQDVPLYSVDEFKRLAPEEARTEQVLSSDHQLMLNRLSFELAERQRLDFPSDHILIYPSLIYT